MGNEDVGFLIHAPDKVKQAFPRFKAVDSLSDLFKWIWAELKSQSSAPSFTSPIHSDYEYDDEDEEDKFSLPP
jgi:hypothetical protein